MNNNSLRSLFQHKRLLLISGLVILVLTLLVFSLFGPARNQTPQQKPFAVVSTHPSDGETNVYSGEIQIGFTTDVPIISQDSFQLSINPPLPHYWKITNTYPTNQIIAQVYGGLDTNMIYAVTVKNESSKIIRMWRFTTSSKGPRDASKLTVDQDNKIIADYYPLLKYMPYNTNSFSIDYTDRITLRVEIKNQNISAVKQEVEAWIRSKGVDPTSHKINYINKF